MVRISDPDTAYRALRALELGRYVYYLQEFVPHGCEDIRVFVAGQQVVAAMVRQGRTWKTNIAQGAQAVPLSPDASLSDLACRAAQTVGADYAGVSRLQYPPNVHLIRVMCTGRVDEKFIWEGFRQGAPVILVSGCHIGDCHYIDANHWTEKRVARIRKKMEKIGLRPERLQLEWISAAEGIRFAETMKRMETLRRTVTAEEIAETQSILSKL